MPNNHFVWTGSEITLDVRPDRLDIRDRQFTPAVRHLPPSCPSPEWIAARWQAYVDAGMILNQGSAGACTGFGLSAVINYLHWCENPDHQQVSPRMVYHLAKFYDEWQGDDYAGSSCRGALKGWNKHGVCRRDLWPFTVHADNTAISWEAPAPGWEQDAQTRPLGVYYRINKDSISDMQAALAETGAVYVSASVHTGWYLSSHRPPKKPQPLTSLDQLPLIPAEAQGIGGHAFALIGYTSQGFVVQNSWGTGWGCQGLAILSYEDWQNNGTDAWAVALGVPTSGVSAYSSTDSYTPFMSGPSLLSGLAPPMASKRGVPRQHKKSAHATYSLPPLSLDQAYGLSLVMDNNGALIQRLVAFKNAATSAEHIVYHAPLAAYTQHKSKRAFKLTLFALSGLADEDTTLAHIASLAPYFLANGSYPIFLTWNSGLGGSVNQLLTSEFSSVRVSPGAAAAQDMSIESYAATNGGKAEWALLKQNAEQSVFNDSPPRGLHALVRNLQKLATAIGEGHLEIHLVAHSAGAQLIGNLIPYLKKFTIKTCSLYAPACSIDFANAKFLPALESGFIPRNQFHLHVMSDELEKSDNVAQVYNKSLLYLLARSFEVRHKTPMLGMATSLDADFFSGKSRTMHNGIRRQFLRSENGMTRIGVNNCREDLQIKG
ncbi:hypothetical protein ACO0K0_18680 [Undibacterium sp. SXout11W]|uniref:C1 family peptidase n=1 Tax=Undibacterium sp. SXout11W TaxID=3413050 RepID=UPI003BF131C2